jgi:hypothetical protein
MRRVDIFMVRDEPFTDTHVAEVFIPLMCVNNVSEVRTLPWTETGHRMRAIRKVGSYNLTIGTTAFIHETTLNYGKQNSVDRRTQLQLDIRAMQQQQTLLYHIIM